MRRAEFLGTLIAAASRHDPPTPENLHPYCKLRGANANMPFEPGKFISDQIHLLISTFATSSLLVQLFLSSARHCYRFLKSHFQSIAMWKNQKLQPCCGTLAACGGHTGPHVTPSLASDFEPSHADPILAHIYAGAKLDQHTLILSQ